MDFPSDSAEAGERVQIRVLGRHDAETLRDMLSMFGRALDDLTTYTARQPDDAYLEALLASWIFIAVAALAGPAVIGGLAAYVLPKFEQARSELYIYDLAQPDAAHIEASRDYVTLGEMCDALRDVWGVWRETPVF